jgi:hypothetical protein
MAPSTETAFRFMSAMHDTPVWDICITSASNPHSQISMDFVFGFAVCPSFYVEKKQLDTSLVNFINDMGLSPIERLEDLPEDPIDELVCPLAEQLQFKKNKISYKIDADIRGTGYYACT